MPKNDPASTIREIMTRKRGAIKSAPLSPGCPPWGELLDWTWAEVEEAAARGEPGMKTVRKLLTDQEYDR